MATKITLTIPEGLSEAEKADLSLLLSDSFGEFKYARTTAEEYVNKRYPGDEVFAREARKAKVEQVKRRCNLADKLVHQCFNVKIEEIADED